MLSLLLVFSAVPDITRDPKITEGLKALGVPDNWFLPLGLVKIAGALGLLAGIAYRPLGIAAATGVVLYFLGAVMTHVRGGDKKEAPPRPPSCSLPWRRWYWGSRRSDRAPPRDVDGSDGARRPPPSSAGRPRTCRCHPQLPACCAGNWPSA